MKLAKRAKEMPLERTLKELNLEFSHFNQMNKSQVFIDRTNAA